jgi:hypothetical protein
LNRIVLKLVKLTLDKQFIHSMQELKAMSST